MALVFLIIRARTQRLVKERLRLVEEKERLQQEIDKRIKAQNKLIKSESKLKEANEELNTFLYKASHDLKGPLATVNGLTNIALRDELQGQSASKYFTMIKTSVRKLDNVLRNLVDVTDIRRNELRFEEVQFIETLEKCLTGLKQTYNVDAYKLDFTEINNFTLHTDERLLFQIIYQVLDNSFCEA